MCITSQNRTKKHRKNKGDVIKAIYVTRKTSRADWSSLFAKRSKTSQSTRRDKNNFMFHRRKNEPGFPLTRQRSVTNYYWFSKFPWEAHPIQKAGLRPNQPRTQGLSVSPPRMQTLNPSQEVIVLMCKLLRWFIVMGRRKRQSVGHLRLESVVKVTRSFAIPCSKDKAI